MKVVQIEDVKWNDLSSIDSGDGDIQVVTEDTQISFSYTININGRIIKGGCSGFAVDFCYNVDWLLFHIIEGNIEDSLKEYVLDFYGLHMIDQD
jgi:hypothetical protein